MRYNPGNIEQKWRTYWLENEVYKVTNDDSKPKFYILDMFPYPSGAGLHVGHPLGYIASDIFARFKTLKGYNVLHPMGFDAFGLPAEQYAIQLGVHPAKSTEENVKKYKSQLINLGLNYDWSRAVTTSNPSYYKWTQWIFILLFNHYYDTQKNKAKPIADLIEKFEANGNKNAEAFNSHGEIFSAEEWISYSKSEKDEVLMGYRLAYRKVGYVNWCEELGTVLANDEVKDGISERGGYPVVKKAMKQWSLRITAYAERLLKDMENLDWSDALKAMQKNWIGRSEGAQLYFDIEGNKEKIEVFTTRPDTIFGATFMVLAPELDLVTQITTKEQKEAVDKYVKYVTTRSDIDRMSEVKEVTGEFTGAYAINPFTKKKIPIWIAEYVLKDYGTGAIMAVPSDDERDSAFAQKYEIEIIDVVDKSNYPGSSMHDKTGVMINSDFLNGMEVIPAITEINKRIEALRIGSPKINYKLRDANYSRQRYWGEPFPIYYDKEGTTYAEKEADLPLLLPDLDDFKPATGGKSPLARLESWVNTDKGIRETDTMPGYAGSSWYFLRYMDPHNNEEFASQKALNYWKEVDLYIGGTEHAVGHLMYSRFWHKFLFDKGMVPTNEPFKKLINQGMIQGVIEYLMLDKEKKEGYNRFLCSKLTGDEASSEFVRIPIHVDFVQNYGSSDSYINIDSIKKFIDWRPEYKDAIFECSKGVYHQGVFKPKNGSDNNHLFTKSEVGKMSKRYFNVVNPDDVVDQYGADCFRMYEMFLGPIEQSKPWDTNGIDGVFKFLRKYWSLFFNDEEEFKVSNEAATKEEMKHLHTAIKKVSEDIEKYSFNTCVSAFMVLTNELKKLNCNKLEILEPLTILLAPFAPYVTEEVWAMLGNKDSIHHADYPVLEPSYLVEDIVSYPICVNGKKRALADFPTSASKDELEAIVLKMEGLEKWIEGKEIKRVIVVPGRMINLVV
jgi:leucyl-tRNA synthetase